MKIKKPVYKRVWFWLIVVFLFLGFGSSLGDDDKIPENNDNPVADSGVKKDEPKKEKKEEPKEEQKEEPKEEPKEEVSREFKNALGSAKDYLNFMAFSKEGLYDQLIFEEYPDEAARYAVENVVVDWNENALETAQSYLDMSNFSDAGLYDQLIFEKYTPEQAKYAIDNLE